MSENMIAASYERAIESTGGTLIIDNLINIK